MSSPPAGIERPPRGRRGQRPSGDERERAILETAERLLGERPLTAVSIDDLARGAGISRPTFYFYFRSKEAVLLALFDRVIEEADSALAVLLAQPDDDAAQYLRDIIAAFHETFRRHRAVTLAAAEASAANAEVRALWAAVMEKWVTRTAEAVEAARAAGRAPDGLPARDLGIVLTSMNERVMSATFSGEGPAVAEEDVVDVLLGVWLRAIYGTPVLPPPA